jgi:hypothetical protein
MATFRGTIRKNDLEGGIWELHADDGEHYQLRSGDDSLLVDGQKVEIHGKIDKAGFGIGMTGPILDVTSWKAS